MIVLLALALAMTLSFATVFAAFATTANADGVTIAADKAEYEPGDTVVLAGTGFAAGEVVTITAAGDTNGTVVTATATADASGAVSASLSLPLMFEFTYAVSAAGDQGSSATTSFTDGFGKLVLNAPNSPFTRPDMTWTTLVVSTQNSAGAAVGGVPVRFTDLRLNGTSGGFGKGGSSTTTCASSASNGSLSVAWYAGSAVSLYGTYQDSINAQGQSKCSGGSAVANQVGWTANIYDPIALDALCDTPLYDGLGTNDCTAADPLNPANSAKYALPTGQAVHSVILAVTNVSSATCGPNAGKTVDQITDGNLGVSIDIKGVLADGTTAYIDHACGTYDFSNTLKYANVNFTYTAGSDRRDSKVVYHQYAAGDPLAPTPNGDPSGQDANNTVLVFLANGSSNSGGRGNAAAGYSVFNPVTPVTIGFSNLNPTYDGSPQDAGVTTSPAATFSVTYTGTNGTTYDPSSTPPTNAGSYTVHVVITQTGFSGTQDATLTINKADATVKVTGYTGTYDAAAHGASGTASGVGGANLAASLNLGATFTDVPGGTATWTFSNPNYNDQSATASIVINKADATVKITGYAGTYDAVAHGASGTAGGVNNVDLAASLNLGSSFTDVPGGTATWTFSNPNYNDQSGTAAIVINKAAATVNVTGYTGTYDAAAHSASGTASGVGGADLAASLNLGATFTDVPGGTATWTFSNPNYNDQSGTTSITITQATATVTTTPYSGVYDGNPHGASGSAKGVNNVDLSALLGFTNNSYTNVPGGTASWTFTGGTNYKSAMGTATITISKALSTTTISAGYNGPYTDTAHPATATVTGAGTLTGSATLTYSSGTAPVTAGSYTATATYAGDTNHTGSSASTTITIAKAGNALIVQTGLQDFTSTGVGVTTVTVTSSATVTTPFANVADAHVTFVLDTSPTTPIPGCGDLAIGAVSGTVGSASCQWTGNTGNSGGNTYTVIALVGFGGSWTGNSDTLTVNVHQPLNTSFITGGGYLTLTNSAGQYKGTGKNNFGFNVKYNKSGTNLQGNANIIVRSGDMVYQFKSNALNQLTVNPAATGGGTANFTGKASLQSWNVNSATTINSLGGNLTIQLIMQDVAEPGAGKDVLSIAVWESTGALLFSSNWNGTQTVTQTITGGNLQVH